MATGERNDLQGKTSTPCDVEVESSQRLIYPKNIYKPARRRPA
jgi:hypothetical protein